MRRSLILLPALLTLVLPSMAAPAAADGCNFVLGFATLASLIPQQVGQCVDNEGHNPANGDALQHTTGGLLVWRKADNWTAFTDGYHTWIAGPNGLAERLNTQRFSWEANRDGLPLADIAGLPARFVDTWFAHTAFLQVHADGSATLDWRNYTWCGPGVAPPCDHTVDLPYLPNQVLLQLQMRPESSAPGPMRAGKGSSRQVHREQRS